MTITQTVDIPESRRLTIDVPCEVPVGKALLAFTPVSNQRPDSAMPENSRSWRDLYGCCKDQPGSVEDFLADCRADKERELAIEERNRRA